MEKFLLDTNVIVEMLRDIPFVENMFDIAALYPALNCFGEKLAYLRKNGITVDYFDVLIAATAIDNNYTLITHNTKHFSRIPGLSFSDWQ